MARIVSPELYRSLSVPEYRRYFLANLSSSFGSWMERLGMSWLVYRLTDSAIWIALIMFSSWFSSFLLMPYAGAVLDTRGRRNIMRISQLVAMTQAFILGILTLTGHINVYIILVLSAVLGVANAFDMIGRNSLINDMFTEKSLLANAVALNSTAFNLARMIGPALAGFIVKRWGEGVCFIINGFSFLPFAYVLATMRLASETVIKKHGDDTPKLSSFARIKEGVAYARSHPIIMPILVLLSIISFMGMSIHMVLYPLIAKEVLGGDAETLGILTGAMGIGALAGAFILASFRKIDRMHRLTSFAFGALGVVSLVLAYSQNMRMALITSMFFGVFMVLGWGSSNTLIQTITPKDKISRMMSLSNMTFTGMSPLGGLFMGWFAEKVSVQIAIFTGGSFCVITGLFCYLKIYKIKAELS
jgi:MFS family permease